MSALSNESFFHYRCDEATLPFRAITQRFQTVISCPCTNQFTDAASSGWKLIYIEVYGQDITELSLGGSNR